MGARRREGLQKLAAMSKRGGAMLAIAVDAARPRPDEESTCSNGTLHVDKRRYADEGYVALRPHDPADYITRLAPVTYDPARRVRRSTTGFLDVTSSRPDFGGDGVRRGAHAQRVPARVVRPRAHRGDTSEQKMVFLYGKGRNGKGVLVNIASHVAGTYADSIPDRELPGFGEGARGRPGDARHRRAARRAAAGDVEPKKGATLDEAFVKLFTGGDRLKARHLNKDFFAFTPQAKLTMQGNYRPKISGADEGIWGRIILVPFGVFIPPERRDPGLYDKLKAEGSGILNRLLDGLRMWLEDGLVLPDAVRAATKQYREDSATRSGASSRRARCRTSAAAFRRR